MPLICLNEFNAIFKIFFLLSTGITWYLKHIQKAEYIYVSCCEFLLNTVWGKYETLGPVLWETQYCLAKILPRMLLAVLKICYSKTRHSWLARMQNYCLRFLFHKQFPTRTSYFSPWVSTLGLWCLHSAEVQENTDKTAACALILCSPGAEVILVELSSLVSALWCRIKDLASQHWIPEKSNQEATSKAYKCISAVSHGSIQSKVARTTLFQSEW